VTYGTVGFVLAFAEVYLVGRQPDCARSEKHQADDRDPELIAFHVIPSLTLRINAAPFPGFVR
jgi:hypothetical protein